MLWRKWKRKSNANPFGSIVAEAEAQSWYSNNFIFGKPHPPPSARGLNKQKLGWTDKATYFKLLLFTLVNRSQLHQKKLSSKIAASFAQTTIVKDGFEGEHTLKNFQLKCCSASKLVDSSVASMQRWQWTILYNWRVGANIFRTPVSSRVQVGCCWRRRCGKVLLDNPADTKPFRRRVRSNNWR